MSKRGKESRYDIVGEGDESSSQSADTEEESDSPGGDQSSVSAASSTNRDGDQLPHRVRCDSPSEDRMVRSVPIEGDDAKQIAQWKVVAETTFDQTVYKMDVFLAALRAGLTASEDDFLSQMEKMGYGHD